jgi:MFS family permease
MGKPGTDIFSFHLIDLGDVLFLLHQYLLLIGAAIVTGIGNALLIPALSTIYLGTTTKHNRSQVMGIRGTAISPGTFLGPLAQAFASPWIMSQMTFAIGLAVSLAMMLFALIVVKR